MRNLYYFVFTSGEEGVHGLDWGVKFSSQGLGDSVELDVDYRNLLKSFGLSPSLERPNKDDGVGLLLLPNNIGKLLIFIIPGKDLKGRPNTVAIACNIPMDLAFAFNVREVARRIWNANNLMQISARGALRPDVLIFPDESAPAIEYPFFASSGLIRWPENNAFLSINGNIRELAFVLRVETPEPKKELDVIKIKGDEPKSRTKIFIFATIVAVIGVGFYAASDMFELDEEPLKKEEQQEIKNQEKSPDLTLSSLIEKEKVSQKINDIPATTPKHPEDYYNEIVEKNLLECLNSLKPYDKPVILSDRNNGKFLSFEIENYNENEFFSKIFDEARKHIAIEPAKNRELYAVRLYFWHDDEKLGRGHIDFDMAIEIFINQAMEAKSN